jgi:2-methylcitrate dehydratase PrpD
VTLQDGRQYEAEVATLLGHPTRPLSRQQVLDKFRSCCAVAARPVTESAIRGMVEAIDDLENLSDAGLIARRAALTPEEVSD